ncbi:MAG: DUF2087 domain-containing protein [Myxococcota bacterium]
MITVDEFVERLCKICGDPGARPLPRARRDREILMQSILMSLDSARSYDEAELNELLRTWLREIAPAIESDHVTLRRMLVDYGRLERTASGSAYRVGFPPRATAFELAIYDLDLRGTITAYRERSAARRRTRGAAAGTSHSAKPKGAEPEAES